MRALTSFKLQCAVILFAGAAACGTRNESTGKMPEAYIDDTWKRPVELADRPVAIRPGGKRQRMKPASPDAALPDVRQRYVEPSLTSRLRSPLPSGRWEVLWNSELEDDLFPEVVLLHGGRIVVQGSREWMLINDRGESLETGRFGFSDVVLDPEHGLFYALDRTGYLAAWQLTDGKPAFRMPITFGEEFARTAILRRDNRLLIAGIERQLDAHSHPPERSRIEIVSLGEPMEIDDEQMLHSAVPLRSLDRWSTTLFTAAHDDEIAIAVKDTLYVAGFGLDVRRILTGDFTPMAMSVDEAGRIYLLVNADDGGERVAFWRVTPEGERTVDVDMSTFVQNEVQAHPPIIGFDHRVYFTVDAQIMTLERGGSLAWQTQLESPVVGALVTGDDRLLVTSGGIISAFDKMGEREVIFFLEDGEWVTAAVVAPDGRIYAATDGHLYCLTISKP